MTKPYEYPPVLLPNKDGDPHIRLLDILPSCLGQKLQLKLRAVPLRSKHARYEALSYTWGASTEGRIVTVDGSYRFPVTDNLFSALRRLRWTIRTRTMWIDALCINQQDLEERAVQVKMMGEIYERAACVDIWLGESHPDIHVDIESMWHTLGRHVPRDHSGRHRKKLWLLLLMLRNDGEVLEDAIENSSLRWYDRVWTIQEFIKASRTRLLFGPRTWTLDQLALAPRNRYSPQDHPVRRMYHADALWNRLQVPFYLDAPIHRNLHRHHFGLVEAIRLVWRSDATDPRDRVYGILGLVEPYIASRVGVDYSIPISQVYARATQAIFEELGHHSALGTVQSIDSSERQGWPSWVIDFGSDEAIFRLCHAMLSTVTNNFELATGQSNTGRKANYQTDKLFFEGANCGKIADLCLLDVDWTMDYLFQWVHAAYTTRRGKKCTPAADAVLYRALTTPRPEYDWYGETLHRILNPGSNVLISGIVPLVFPFVYWDDLAHSSCKAGSLPRPTSSLQDIYYSHDRSRGDDSGNPTAYKPSNVCLFVLENGHIGVAGESIRIGDVLVVSKSAGGPDFSRFFVLRPDDNSGEYKFRALVYLHGCMGHLFWKDWELPASMFETYVIS